MKKLFLLGLFVFLSGCDNQETYTVDYLIENQETLDQVLEQCKENEQSVINCENAHKASSIIFNSTGGKEVHEWQ